MTIRGIALYKLPDDPEILEKLLDAGVFIFIPGDIVKVIIEENITTA